MNTAEGLFYRAKCAELEAYLEARERTVNALSGELSTYERIVTEYMATVNAQHDTIKRLDDGLAAEIFKRNSRIAELEEQNAWLQAQLSAANAVFGHTVEDEATEEYAEECAP